MNPVIFEAVANRGGRIDKKPYIVFEAHPAHATHFMLVSVPMKKAERKKWWGRRVRVTVEVIEEE